MKMELVTFADHHHDNSSWNKPSDLDMSEYLIQYVGWVIKEDKEHIVLAQGRDAKGDDREYDSFMRIMKGCIRKRRVLI